MSDRKQLILHIGSCTAGVLLALLASATLAFGHARVSAVPASQMLAIRIELRPTGQRPAPVFARSISASDDSGDALKKLIAAHRCLAEEIYFGARTLGVNGERAAANIALRRLAQGTHGKSICAVVYQGAARHACHFRFACDNALDRPKNPEAWRAAQALAAKILARELPAANGGPTTTVHAVSARAPAKTVRVSLIGNHPLTDGKYSVASVVFRKPLP